MGRVLKFYHKGNFTKTTKFFNNLLDRKYLNKLDFYGQKGVEALQAATPRDTGETANSWSYEIRQDGKRATITWTNSHIEKHVNIAIILQYGHATRNGGWIEGRDYINPALQPLFDQMAEEIWGEVIETNE